MFYVWILDLMENHTDRWNSSTNAVWDVIEELSHTVIYPNYLKYNNK